MDFEGPTLAPAPVPPIAEAPADLADLWRTQVEPLMDRAALAVQVAMLTAALNRTLERLDAAEDELWRRSKF